VTSDYELLLVITLSETRFITRISSEPVPYFHVPHRLTNWERWNHRLTNREILIAPMTAYDLVLGLPWFKTGNPEVDGEEGKLLSLRRQPTKPHSHGKEARAGPDIQMLSAAALEASTKFSGAFDLTLGECRGMLGATVESHYNDSEQLLP
jgi:hypothetical protein